MVRFRSVLLFALSLVLLAVGSARGFETSMLAEKVVSQLPPDPLVWRIETFPSKVAAEAAESATGLVADAEGHMWLFTLGPQGDSSPGGTFVTEIGPLPVSPASQYQLRVELNIAAPGEKTTPHIHPGSESWYVLVGEVCVRTPSGNTRARAGQKLTGPPGGTSLESVSTGLVARRAFVLTVFDATKQRILPGSLPPGSC